MLLVRAASAGVLALWYAFATRDAASSVLVGAAPLAGGASSSASGGAPPDADVLHDSAAFDDDPNPPSSPSSAKDRPRHRPGGYHETMTPEQRASHAAHRADVSRRIQERRRKARERIQRHNAARALEEEAEAAEGKKRGPAAAASEAPEDREDERKGQSPPRGRRTLEGMRPSGKLERVGKGEMERLAEEARTAAANSVRRGKQRQEERRAAREAEAGADASSNERPRKTPAAERRAASSTRNYDWMRRAGWGSSSSSVGGVPSNYDAYDSPGGFLDPGDEYDWWAQGYRFLGGYIDCDHGRENAHNWRRGLNEDEEAEYDQNERDLSGSKDGDGYYGCQRWAMWAAYVNPNYQGNGYDEYYGDGCGDDDSSSACSTLDCHDSDTEWILLGVYRQEFYQWVEQISKHLWAIDEYDYVVALAGLAYMTDYDCWQVGNDNSGNALYAGTRPVQYGRWQMGVYTDQYCLELDESGITYDDFGLGGYLNLGSKDETGCSYGDDRRRKRRLEGEGGDNSSGRELEDNYNYNGNGGCDELEEYWSSTQEYTLTNINDVYDNFKFCTPCMDYPTYQDGYFIGDYGTDDDDLINQCWKFHSHDSFVCEGDCINMGAKQGTILEVEVNGMIFGQSWDAETSFGTNPNANGQHTTKSGPSKMDKLKANLFVGFAGILFVATFLAFAVARGSGRKDRSGKSRSLLTPEERARARRRSRSKARASSSGGRDRASGDRSTRSTRSKSRNASGGDRDRGDRSDRERERASSRSKSRSRRESRGGSGSDGRSPRAESSPARSKSRSKSRRSRSSKYNDDF